MRWREISNFKIAFLWIKIKFFGLIAKICRLCKWTITYESATGIKEINPKMVALLSDQGKREIIPYDKLYLGVDFLKDDLTLLDVPITQSPHYDLMKVLVEGRDHKKTEYVQRMLRGCLDERYEIVAYYLDKDYFTNRFKQRKKEIDEEISKPVTVYYINEKYYIYDGKHRAALFAFCGKEIYCNVIDAKIVFESFSKNISKRLIKSGQYTKHKNLFLSCF